jgi:hypothetical protein
MSDQDQNQGGNGVGKRQDRPRVEREVIREFELGDGGLLQLKKLDLRQPQYSLSFGTRRQNKETGEEYFAPFLRASYTLGEDGKADVEEGKQRLLTAVAEAFNALVVDIESQRAWSDKRGIGGAGKTARERESGKAAKHAENLRNRSQADRAAAKGGKKGA